MTHKRQIQDVLLSSFHQKSLIHLNVHMTRSSLAMERGLSAKGLLPKTHCKAFDNAARFSEKLTRDIPTIWTLMERSKKPLIPIKPCDIIVHDYNNVAAKHKKVRDFLATAAAVIITGADGEVCVLDTNEYCKETLGLTTVLPADCITNFSEEFFDCDNVTTSTEILSWLGQ